MSRKRVAPLMKQAQIEGISRRKKTPTTRSRPDRRPVPDLVERDFAADGPNRLWVADITFVPTWAGFIFLVVVLDAFSRRIAGWSMANHLKTKLVTDALEMALQRRKERLLK